jgi:hypothetical protein
MKLRHAVEKKAYELYEKSGYICGSDIEHWLEAEKIVYAGFLGADGKSAIRIKSAPVNAEQNEDKPAKRRATKAKSQKAVAVKRTAKKTSK